MDGLLTPVSTTRRKDAPLLQEVPSISSSIKPAESAPDTARAVPKSPEEVLEILRHEPGYDSLIHTLRVLKHGRFEQKTFQISKPSPIGSQIVHILVTDIAPNYWTLLQEEALHDAENRTNGAKRGSTAGLQLFLGCVRSLTGINAVLLRLRALTQEAKSEKKDVKRPDLLADLRITLALLEALLEGTDCIQRLWISAIADAHSPVTRRPLAQEFIALLGSGRVISYAAEADDTVRLAADKKASANARWISDGAEYSRWLGRNLVRWLSQDVSPDDVKLCSDLLARSLRLGYSGECPRLPI